MVGDVVADEDEGGLSVFKRFVVARDGRLNAESIAVWTAMDDGVRATAAANMRRWLAAQA